MFWKRFKNRRIIKSEYISVEEFNNLKNQMDLIIKENVLLKTKLNDVIQYIDYLTSQVNNLVGADISKLERISKLLIVLQNEVKEKNED
jgi:hypothetical protein